MKKIACAIALSLLLLGCGSSKPVPDWTNASFNDLDNYKKNYLSGKSGIAEEYFNRAVDEIKGSGNLDILAKAYLTKYAVHVAVLEPFCGNEYLMIEEVEPVGENRNFYDFLGGTFERVDERLLPKQYADFFRTFRDRNDDDFVKGISDMDNPLSRLIAVGLLVKKNTYDEKILKLAIDTASQNGWKKALLAYMARLQILYEKNNSPNKAAVVGEKIRLLK